MPLRSRKTFPTALLFLVFVSAALFAGGHHSLNGTWILVPDRSDFAGQTVYKTGTIVINDREHNISVSRSFTYDGQDQSFTYTFSTDGRENSTIHDGKTFKSKAKWDGDVLRVTTTQDNATTIEHYSLRPDGSLMLVVDRPGHSPVSLLFERR